MDWCKYIAVMCCISKYTTIMFLTTFLWFPELCNNDSMNGSDRPAYRQTFGGTKAKLEDLPYQVSIRKQASSKSRRNYRRKYRPGRLPPTSSSSRYYSSNAYDAVCAGVLITTEKVLSVASCFVGDPDCCDKCCGSTQGMSSLSHMYAVAGTLGSSGTKFKTPDHSEQWRKIKSVSVPPSYNYNDKFPASDFGIVHTEAFTINKFVSLIKYAKTYKEYGSRLCTVSGFGKRRIYEPLMMTELVLIENNQCSKLNHRNMKHFICTNVDVTGAKLDLAGSSLVCTNNGTAELVGLACGIQGKFGVQDKNDTQERGSIFTRVSSYSNFIKNSSNFYILTIEYQCFCVLVANYIRQLLL